MRERGKWGEINMEEVKGRDMCEGIRRDNAKEIKEH
jgi:hypothetical protein